jgi:hypothetical protein
MIGGHRVIDSRSESKFPAGQQCLVERLTYVRLLLPFVGFGILQRMGRPCRARDDIVVFMMFKTYQQLRETTFNGFAISDANLP